MNKIIEETLENDIPVTTTINPQTKKKEYMLEGFYKSGIVKLIEEDDKLIAISRYNERTNVESLFDIVLLNYEWWVSSKERYEGWENPDNMWIPLLLKFNLIKHVVKTIEYYE